MTCPNDCSGHGICRTVKDIAATKATKRLVDSVASVNTYSGPQDYFVYRLWDADKHRACACDPGYGGYDCSDRECPRGDDPLTNTPSTCGGVACANEVQNFLVAPNQGTNADGEVTYKLRFFDYNGYKFDTNDFVVKTKSTNYGTDAVKQASVASGIKTALELLPNNITGLVAVNVYGDTTLGAPDNVRVAITFNSLSGNVPDMNLLQGSSAASQGSPAIAQPFQRVQTVTMTGLTTSSVITATIFPLNMTTVRKDAALTTKWQPVTGAVIDDTTTSGTMAALPTTSASDVQTAILAAIKNIPAIAYYGQNSVTARTDISGGTWVTTLIMPNADYGANEIQWGVAGAGSVTSQSTWSTDGNKEFSVCSNRGVCDSSSGLCSCFTGEWTVVACSAWPYTAFCVVVQVPLMRPNALTALTCAFVHFPLASLFAGYYGAACDVQSALAQ